ncbi:TetR/AcrR family transcriptional regulator [Pseudoduganella aquatica]|uniref:TetR/AcrR family transcriptional regulator n=1 Tax=Pseudoduganella aquatica TaxID=2660641 RepID=UPI001E336BA9|nr:TetR/AcrR family transcriptional regulator [Pseudoduganella aquatica]
MPEPELFGLPLCPAKTAGRPRASEAEARTQELVEIAARLFLEKGYSKVSLEMIAKQARVAVRTIYVKFGGKAGLFTAVINAGCAHFFATMHDMETSVRPLREILLDFGLRFGQLVASPQVLAVHRMVIAESMSNPELAQAFFEAGPRQTREALQRFFARPDIRSQLRGDMTPEALTVHLLNCIMGDQLKRYLFVINQTLPMPDVLRQVEVGVDLFLGGALQK